MKCEQGRGALSFSRLSRQPSRPPAEASHTFPDSAIGATSCNRLSEYADEASNPHPSSCIFLHIQRGLGEEMARGTPDVAWDELGCRFPNFRDGSAAFGLATASVAPGPCHRVCMECLCPCPPSGCERQHLVRSWVDLAWSEFGVCLRAAIPACACAAPVMLSPALITKTSQV